MAIEETDPLPVLDFVQQPRAIRQRGLSNASSKPQSQPDLGTAAPKVVEEEEEEEGDDLGDDSGSAYEESIHQVVAVTAEVSSKPKRGRKPAPAQSRAARDLARKSNHSRIEKRRREKINDALATLREIVPPATIAENPGDAPPPAVEDDAPTSGKGKKKGGSEREFKLEVLERSVIFIRQLSQRVQELEDELTRTQLPKSSDSDPDRKIGEDLSPRKRRRDSLSPSAEDRHPRQRLSPFPDPSNHNIPAMPLPASPPDSTVSPYFAPRTSSDTLANPVNTLSNVNAERRMSLPSISEMHHERL
ncbi:hypothetical protein BS47DRAFT_198415 [Hydnum rufescens UP504]|uniref:BHLH domain-containing protein n=1 Tax=Hydnum rufescens UP504 TaxID=1448309 RepID=A0A9P6B770_9AGAM|nr:hypothetical protein BS47DRAFT_198415 [Hydnum rufescens UP504]